MKFGAGADAEKMPDWLPSYPGVTPEGTYSMQGDKGSAGAFTFATTDPAKEVLDYYEGQLKAAGLRVRRHLETERSGCRGRGHWRRQSQQQNGRSDGRHERE